MQRRRCTVGCGPLITIYNILYTCLGVAIDCLVQHGPRLLLLSVGHAIHPSLTAKGICGSYILSAEQLYVYLVISTEFIRQGKANRVHVRSSVD